METCYYIQLPNGKFTYVDTDGSVVQCVSCGRPIEYERQKQDSANHKCPPRHDAAQRAANTRLEEPIVRKPSWHERFTDGAEQLNGELP